MNRRLFFEIAVVGLWITVMIHLARHIAEDLGLRPVIREFLGLEPW